MTKELFFQAISKFALGLILITLLLFLPAGTLRYWNGWLLITILFVPMFFAGIVMMLRNPELLKKRLNAKEEEAEQKTVVVLSALMFLGAFIAAGMNFRFAWVTMPRWSVFLGTAVFLAAYLLYAEVLRENAYLSRTMEVQDGQKVVSPGLYGIVRHPMYAATLFLFLSMPFILGSPVSFVIMLVYVPIICKRIRNEENVLLEGLSGYPEYCRKVRWRLLPHVW